MLEPLQTFLFNWECVEASLVAEADAMKEAQKDAKNKQPEIGFDDWTALVAKENAATIKEQKYGIKRKKK